MWKNRATIADSQEVDTSVRSHGQSTRKSVGGRSTAVAESKVVVSEAPVNTSDVDRAVQELVDTVAEDSLSPPTESEDKVVALWRVCAVCSNLKCIFCSWRTFMHPRCIP